eukprot:351243-Chlamydomonas_euryale.AAC.9
MKKIKPRCDRGMCIVQVGKGECGGGRSCARGMHMLVEGVCGCGCGGGREACGGREVQVLRPQSYNPQPGPTTRWQRAHGQKPGLRVRKHGARRVGTGRQSRHASGAHRVAAAPSPAVCATVCWMSVCQGPQLSDSGAWEEPPSAAGT